MTVEHAELVDAEVVGGELVTLEQHGVSLFGTNDPVETMQKAGDVAAALKDVLVKQNMTTTIRGKTHVNVEGWTTLGSMLGIVPVIVWTREIDGGWEARAEARTMTGHVVGAAEAMCVAAEGGNWGPKATSNARRAMAQTRAMSRALRGPLGFVVTLAGYQATAPEEMPEEPAPAPISADRAANVGLLIHEKLQAGMDPGKLSLFWSQAGAHADTINAAAVANLTDRQADVIETALRAA